MADLEEAVHQQAFSDEGDDPELREPTGGQLAWQAPAEPAARGEPASLASLSLQPAELLDAAVRGTPAVEEDADDPAAAEAPADGELPPSPGGQVDGPDDMTCAICLEQVNPVDMATVKGCEHLYCVHCILQWAMCKDEARCPTCKSPFTYIYSHRLLDGTVVDFPVEETVTLLKRAKWFEEKLKLSEKGQAMLREAQRRGEPLESRSGASHMADWRAEFYDDFEDDGADDDEEIEQFYYSSAAGRARVFGNRRLGENGYLRSGRQFARPLPAQPAPQPSPAGGKHKGKANGPRTPPGNTSGGSAAVPAPSGDGGSSSGGACDASGSGSGGCAEASAAATPPPRTGKGKTYNNPRVKPGAVQRGGEGQAVGGSPPAAAAAGVGSSKTPQPGRRAQRKARRYSVDDGDDDGDY